MEQRLAKLQKELADVKAKKEILTQKERKLCDDIQKIEAMEVKQLLNEHNLTISELAEFLENHSKENEKGVSYQQNVPTTITAQ